MASDRPPPPEPPDEALIEQIAERLMEQSKTDPQLRDTLYLATGRRLPWRRRVRRWMRNRRERRAAPVVGTGYPIPGFFIARPDEVDQRLVDEGPHGQVAAFEAQNMTPIEVANLGEIVGAGAYRELHDRMIESSRAGAGGGCGLFLVPAAITERLAAATDLTSVAARWGATDELRDRVSEQDVRYTLDGAHALATRARAEGRELWVWWWV